MRRVRLISQAGEAGGGVMLIRVDFACNDPDNGDFAGRVSAVTWRGTGHEGIELAYDYFGAGLKFTVERNRLRILRRWYPFERTKAWYGNWCWDAYWFKPAVAKSMLRHFRASGKFQCDGGRALLCDWWCADSLSPNGDDIDERGLSNSTRRE